MDLELRHKTVIVTGGSRGIGAGICAAFAQEGANVVLNYRSQEEQARAFAHSLEQRWGVTVLPVQADVTCPQEVERLFRQAQDAFGPPDVLVNNAVGGVTFKPFQELTYEEWKAAQAGIVDHVFFMSQHFLRECIQASKPGRIIHILSKSSFLSSSVDNLTYVANKGALAALTRGMAKEFIRHGVFVNGIIPGYVNTRAHQEDSPRTAQIRQILPLGELAQPQEIGNVAVILASPLFRQMIGAIVDCTGGTML